MFLVFALCVLVCLRDPVEVIKEPFCREVKEEKKNEKRGAVFSSKPKSILSSPPHDIFISACEAKLVKRVLTSS